MTCKLFWEKDREYVKVETDKRSRYQLEEIGTTAYRNVPDVVSEFVSVYGTDRESVHNRFYNLIAKAKKAGDRVIVYRHRMFEFREVNHEQ